MKRNILIILPLIMALGAAAMRAETPADSTATAAVATTIADRINASQKGARIVQPAALNARLAPKTDGRANAADGTAVAADKIGGYRIQIFSGNNARTAKGEAQSRSAAVGDAFPEYAAYVTYDAPYWRLKVGDFRSYDEARTALERLKAALPRYAREMRLVRDRIKVQE